MEEKQADQGSPESYDVGMMADVRAAFDEASKTEPVADKTPEPAAIAEKAPAAKPETKSDHPSDERRNADGTFKATKGEEAPAKVAPEPQADKAIEPVKALEAAQVKPEAAAQPIIQGAPPPGWSVKSKTEWEKLPEHVRADIVKREKEISDGFSEYAGMKELKPYAEMARSRGQTLKSALDHYMGIETLLSQNPLQGLLRIAGNFGWAPERLAMELSPFLGQSNGQAGQQPGGQSPGQYQVDPNLLQLINPLQQEVTGLKSLLQQQLQSVQTRELGAINSTLDRFKADPAHRYFNNVEPQIIKLFEGGVIPRTGDHAADLKTAYELACRMDPEICETLFSERQAKAEADRKTQEKEAAEKAKLASRSITGSPSAGSKEEPGNDDSIEDTVRKAYRAHAA